MISRKLNKTWIDGKKQAVLWIICSGIYKSSFPFPFPFCAGFDKNRVNFLHSSWYGAISWIWAGNSVNITGMFLLLLSTAYRVRAFSASHTTLLASRLGLAGDTVRNRPKEYSILCDFMFTNKTRRETGVGAAAQGLTGYQSIGGLVVRNCLYLHLLS